MYVFYNYLIYVFGTCKYEILMKIKYVNNEILE